MLEGFFKFTLPYFDKSNIENTAWSNYHSLVKVSINNTIILSLAIDLGLFLQNFDRSFLSRFTLRSYFIFYVFLPLMFLVLLERFCLIAQEGNPVF